jgi:protein-tyrosine phosphatase
MKRVRRLARSVRHLPDRLLHGYRHGRARAVVAAAQPRRVLFVCLGNICRSPYAAAALTAAAGESGVEAASAGFIGPGRRAPDAAQRAAALRGLDLGPHSSRQLTAEMVAAVDLVVVMDAAQRRLLRRRYGNGTPLVLLGDLDPEPIDTRTVRDPYQQADAVFDDVSARISRCIDVLAAQLGDGASLTA